MSSKSSNQRKQTRIGQNKQEIKKEPKEKLKEHIHTHSYKQKTYKNSVGNRNL